MNLEPPDIRIIIISAALVLTATVIYHELHPAYSDQVYKVNSVEDSGKYYKVNAAMYLDQKGHNIEYKDNFSMPLGARAISVHFRIPADEYKPVPGEYIHVKRKKVLNRVTVLDVEKINHSVSVFDITTLD